jgi:hypothetical protein
VDCSCEHGDDLRVAGLHKMLGGSRVGAELAASQERIGFMKLVIY